MEAFAMPFKAILKTLVENTPHAVGAIVVDWEGEAVQEFCNCDPYDIRFIGAHKGIILSRLKEMRSSEQMGAIEDVVVTASEGHLIIGCIDRDYSLVMSVGRSCPASLARHHFHVAIVQLKKEI
jgi:predicted regulator of Ras-like GTPase activity (Roadblock/LC7/MglB family)